MSEKNAEVVRAISEALARRDKIPLSLPVTRGPAFSGTVHTPEVRQLHGRGR
jgi:hypothetical protein